MGNNRFNIFNKINTKTNKINMKKVGISVLVISVIIFIVGLSKYTAISELPISESTIWMEVYEPGIIDKTKKQVIHNEEVGTYIMIGGFCLGILGIGLCSGNTKKEPKKILDLYEKEPKKIQDWKIRLILLDAIERGIIIKKDGVYRYDDKLLGGSIEACIAFLRDVRFNRLLSSIKIETYPELKKEANKL